MQRVGVSEWVKFIDISTFAMWDGVDLLRDARCTSSQVPPPPSHLFIYLLRNMIRRTDTHTADLIVVQRRVVTHGADCGQFDEAVILAAPRGFISFQPMRHRDRNTMLKAQS